MCSLTCHFVKRTKKFMHDAAALRKRTFPLKRICSLGPPSQLRPVLEFD